MLTFPFAFSSTFPFVFSLAFSSVSSFAFSLAFLIFSLISYSYFLCLLFLWLSYFLSYFFYFPSYFLFLFSFLFHVLIFQLLHHLIWIFSTPGIYTNFFMFLIPKSSKITSFWPFSADIFLNTKKFASLIPKFLFLST